MSPIPPAAAVNTACTCVGHPVPNPNACTLAVTVNSPFVNWIAVDTDVNVTGPNPWLHVFAGNTSSDVLSAKVNRMNAADDICRTLPKK